MTIEKLEVLSIDSVNVLRAAASKDQSILSINLENLIDQFDLRTVPTHYLFDVSAASLQLPTGISQEKNNDTVNSINILKALPNITPADATDERLWVSLLLGKFQKYAETRWPHEDKKSDKVNHYQNHWFANTIRGRMRDNAISRLWWMGYISTQIGEWPVEDVASILFANSEYRSSILERNSSSNAVSVILAILKISKRAYDSGKPFQRDPFRNFMKKVNMIGGRAWLAGLTEDQLVSLFEPIYQDSYK
jgi:hypothetical protein